MAVEFNVTANDKFFLGEDKVIDFVIFGPDGATPLNVAGFTLEWTMRKTDKAPDPAIILKTSTLGITIIGVYNTAALTNTQRVRITFVPADTAALKPMTYRHSLKRVDVGNAIVLSFGDFVLRQATEH